MVRNVQIGALPFAASHHFSRVKLSKCLYNQFVCRLNLGHEQTDLQSLLCDAWRACRLWVTDGLFGRGRKPCLFAVHSSDHSGLGPERSHTTKWPAANRSSDRQTVGEAKSRQAGECECHHPRRKQRRRCRTCGQIACHSSKARQKTIPA